MIGTAILREFSQLLLRHGASLEDLTGMVYTEGELNPLTGEYKKYFELITVSRDPVKYPEGFSYKIRYKTDLSGNLIPRGKATYTTKTALLNEAVKMGFDNRISVLKNYELGKDKPKSGSLFYKMLNDYYGEGSKYLEDDTVNNKREIVHRTRIEAQTFVKNDLIPYLQENKIKHISEITTPIYSGFKIYLQAKGIKDKTINNRLIFLLRIFDYHTRNNLLEKLPYTKGTSLIKLSGKQEKEDTELLPIEKLKGIFPHQKLIDPIALIKFINPLAATTDFSTLTKNEQEIIFTGYIMPFTLSVLALNTGMRNSEVGRIKREDFIGVRNKETFLLRIWNKKTEYFNKTNESKYRKIPLHPYTIATVKTYIRRKEEIFGIMGDTDFLFGDAVIDKDTGEVDGFLDSKIYKKAALLLLKLIKYKKNPADFFSDEKELIKAMGNMRALQREQKEMKDAGKGISFYSFRKTFRTMLGLTNDLAEYYMGHKLGDNAKTTYIQVNRLDNNLFVEEYAEPVITMLDKYVYYTEDELEKLTEEGRKKMMNHVDFVGAKIEQGRPIPEAILDYKVKEYKEMEEKERINSEKKSPYDRI